MTCPVLAFTPEVVDVLQWFDRTHQVQAIGLLGPGQWVQTAWPLAGGVGEQDAWLQAAIEWVRAVLNRMLAARPRTDRTAQAELERFRRRHGRHRR